MVEQRGDGADVRGGSESQVKVVINDFLSSVSHDSNIQFSWKVSDKSRFEDLLREALKDPRDENRFRIVDWLVADPTFIVERTSVVAWIRHGGANSSNQVGIPLVPFNMSCILAVRGYRRSSWHSGTICTVWPPGQSIQVSEFTETGTSRQTLRRWGCQKAGGQRTAVDKLIKIIDSKWITRPWLTGFIVVIDVFYCSTGIRTPYSATVSRLSHTARIEQTTERWRFGHSFSRSLPVVRCPHPDPPDRKRDFQGK